MQLNKSYRCFSFAALLAASLISTGHAFAVGGAQEAAGSAKDADCQGTGVDSKIQSWCPLIVKTLNDPSSCAYKSLQQLQGKPVKGLEKVCPGSGGLTAATAVKLTMATMVTESSGDPNATGDGGKSQGLLQTTTGDAFEDCKTGDQKDPETGMRCGLCEMLDPIAKSGTMIGDQPGSQEGLGKQFGPWRRQEAKQMDAAKKACGGGGDGGGGTAKAAPSVGA
jgi:hypothetical protein